MSPENSDSAGQPWAGRHFEQNSSAADDGAAAPHLIAALRAFRSAELGAEPGESAVVDALRTARLLVPLVAHLGEAGVNDHGHVVDKTQELAIVTVLGPDGRRVLPVFSSVDTMRAWNPLARPVPADAVRVAQAALSEETDLVVLDPVSVTEFAMRRPALTALASGEPWTPCYLDEQVLDAISAAADGESAVRSVVLTAGDADARLSGPELVVGLALAPGLDRATLDALVARLQARWSSSELLAQRVDSMTVRLLPAA